MAKCYRSKLGEESELSFTTLSWDVGLVPVQLCLLLAWPMRTRAGSSIRVELACTRVLEFEYSYTNVLEYEVYSYSSRIRNVFVCEYECTRIRILVEYEFESYSYTRMLEYSYARIRVCSRIRIRILARLEGGSPGWHGCACYPLLLSAGLRQ